MSNTQGSPNRLLFCGPDCSDTQAPEISSVAASNVTTNSARITWTTNEPADTQVQYGPTTDYGSSSPLNSSLVTSHSVTLTGLKDNARYHYRVRSRDGAGNLTLSLDRIFTTADGTVPIISSVAVSNVTTNSATIRWNTNEPADAQVEYGLTSSYGSSSPLISSLGTSQRVDLTGLSENTLYHYRVRSRDDAGNLRLGSDGNFSTATENDGGVFIPILRDDGKLILIPLD